MFDQSFNLKCFPSQGKSVTVYVIDTGCRDTHEEFAGRMTLRMTSTYGSGVDDNGHGTHVAGKFLHDNAECPRGASAETRLRLTRCCGRGSSRSGGENWRMYNF